MKLDVSKLSLTKEVKLEEEITFNPEVFVRHRPLIEVNSCKAVVKAQRFEEFLYLNISIVAKVVLECSYTLKPFETTLKGSDELHFAPYKDEEDEDLIEYTGNVIDLDEYIFNILSANVPLSPKAPGASISPKGQGYRVISEEELEKEMSEKGNSAFDCLKDLDLD